MPKLMDKASVESLPRRRAAECAAVAFGMMMRASTVTLPGVTFRVMWRRRISYIRNIDARFFANVT